jgi:DNA-binding Lrp family transcriptional regulator
MWGGRSTWSGNNVLTVKITGNMKSLDQKVLDLKSEGKSLREISSVLGISHEAVRKRLKNLSNKEQVSIKERNQELTALTIKEEKVSTGSKPCKSRASEKIKDNVNQVSTQNTPSLSLTTGVNPFKTLSLKATEGKKDAFPRVLSEIGDLFESIKEFLEDHGIQLYRMQVNQEAYQLNHKDQIIRLYVQRNKEEMG